MLESPLLGVFDSGVGGFSVYKKIREVSQANSIYYGDCARAPYGNREESEIISFIKDDIQFLKDEGATHFVNACNSMSVVTTNSILEACGIGLENYTDMIRASSKHIHNVEGEKILVIATIATLRSKVYQEFLQKEKALVFEYGFIDLARMIEENEKQDTVFALIEPAVIYAKEVKATHILYGCTHYPLIHDVFLEAAQKNAWQGKFIDPAIYVAKEVASWRLSGERKFTPYSSKDTPAFIKNVISFL